MAEFDLIALIRSRAAASAGSMPGSGEGVVLGIGDDAALLRMPAGHELVVTADTLNEGVHFPAGTAPADIGWKALAVNLSDLAAMGASPAWALLSLTLPQADREFVEGFVEGFAQLAGAGLAIVTAVQAFINMGVAVSLLPAKGMTLPFISYGGSSLFAMALTMGLALALTRHRPKISVRKDGVLQWARA